MELEFNSYNQTFHKIETDQSTGNADSFIQSFYSNRWVSWEIKNTKLFEYDTPQYITYGGSQNYYLQDVNSVFTDITNPTISFKFSANTSQLSAATIIHKIYKIDYDAFSKQTEELKNNNAKKEIGLRQIVEKETVIDDNGKSTTKTTIKTTQSIDKNESFKERNFASGNIADENEMCTDLSNKSTRQSDQQTEDSINACDNTNNRSTDEFVHINKRLTEPVLTLTSSTSSITTSIYTLSFNEYYKNLGDYKDKLFTDKAQYFIKTSLQFTRNRGENYLDFYTLNNNGKIEKTINYQKEVVEETPVEDHVITAGTFSGLTVGGSYFSYFLIPNKPKIQEPYVEGVLDTFTPTFYFSDVDDGDEYLLQVTYDSGTSQSFSGNVYSYPIKKEDSALDPEDMITLERDDWDYQKKSTDIIRKYSVPLKKGKQFWFRIGNIKNITNLFGVKQSVVTFSDIGTAITDGTNISSFVQVESDSPYVESMAGFSTPQYLDFNIEDYNLSGTVRGSIVTGATIQLIYPNGNYETKTTSSIGTFIFEGLENGVYILNTIYRGYKADSRSVTINGNTAISYKIKLLWGNDTDTWGKMANENYFI